MNPDPELLAGLVERERKYREMIAKHERRMAQAQLQLPPQMGREDMSPRANYIRRNPERFTRAATGRPAHRPPLGEELQRARWEHSADAARLGARWEPSRAAVRQGKSHTDREWRRQLRHRPTRHPVADKIVAGTLLFFWLVTMAAITYVPNLLGIVVLWVIWSGLFLACWRFYKDQTRPADGKPAVAQVHLPLLVRLFLLPGMVHVVGLPAVTKARHIRTIRRERAQRGGVAAVGYRIDVLEAELAQPERDTLA
jgi:hypothetical protein